MRSVFRAQSAEARLALVLCWLLLLVPVATSWLRLVQSDELLDLRRLFTAVSLTVATWVFVRVQLAACRGGAALRRPWAPPLLIALALLPMVWGVLSLVLCLAIAAAVLQYRRGRAVWVTGATCLGFLVLFPRLELQARVSAAGALLEMLIFAIIFVAVTRLAVLLDDLQLARELLARRHVDLERERVARDLHDLMGRTLVAASLRNQTALRTLGERDPESSARLEQLHRTLSRGQVQLRALTSGPAIAGLDDELAAAQMLCARAGIGLEIRMPQRPPDSQQRLVGLVVRETITQVLKDGRSGRCRLSIDTGSEALLISVGHDRPASGTTPCDSRLEHALAAAGGTLSQRCGSDGELIRVVRIPLPEQVGR